VNCKSSGNQKDFPAAEAKNAFAPWTLAQFRLTRTDKGVFDV